MRSPIGVLVVAASLVAVPGQAVQAQDAWSALGVGSALVDGKRALALGVYGAVRPQVGVGFQARGGLELFFADSTLWALALPLEGGISVPAGPGRLEVGVGFRFLPHSQLPAHLAEDDPGAWFAGLRYALLLGSRVGLSVTLAAGRRVRELILMLEGVPIS